MQTYSASIHKTYVGVKGNVAPMYSSFHTGDKINVRCYAAGDTTVPNIYFTVSQLSNISYYLFEIPFLIVVPFKMTVHLRVVINENF